MRNIYAILIVLLFSSCQDFVDETPKGNLIPKTVDDMGMILDAFDVYEPNAIAYGHGNQTLMTDDSKLPDDIASSARPSVVNSYKWAEHLFDVSVSDQNWDGFYHVIYLCNYILEKIDDAPEGAGEYSRAFVKGSALLNRAHSFFILVNLYAEHYDENTASTALGVPLPLESDINTKYGRATVADVYAQVLIDLKEAVKLLPNKSEYTFQATKPAAFGLLSRFYLYRGEYKKSWQYADSVLKIMPELKDYNKIEQYEPGQPDFGLDNWAPYSGWEKPDVILYKDMGDLSSKYYMSDELLVLFDPTTDLRYRNFVTNYKYYSFTEDPNGYRYSDEADVNRGISLGEVYLTEAEAKLRDNDIDGALKALNDLRVKRYLVGTADVSETNSDALLQIILDERRRETLFKGLRWFDLKRLNKDAKTAKTITHTLFGKSYTLEPGSNRYVLPIPRKVIELNSLIEQNPR